MRLANAWFTIIETVKSTKIIRRLAGDVVSLKGKDSKQNLLYSSFTFHASEWSSACDHMVYVKFRPKRRNVAQKANN